MHIANKRRFVAFLSVVAAVLLAAGAGLWTFRTVPLIDHMARAVDVEQIERLELAYVTERGATETVTLTSPTDIRACMAVLSEARVRRKLWPDTVRISTPGQSFFIRLTDATAREAVLDVAERSIVYNLNTGFYLVEPESLSALDRVRGSLTEAPAA